MAPPGSNKRMGAKAGFVPRFCHHDTRGPPSIFLAQKTGTIADFPIRYRGHAYCSTLQSSGRQGSCSVAISKIGSSKAVGAHFGLTPKMYRSGEKDVTGRITKIGDVSVRTALYEAAHIILTRPIKGGGLKSGAMKLAKRAGMKKAKVALARKLAVVLHRMWVDATNFVENYAHDPVRAAI